MIASITTDVIFDRPLTEREAEDVYDTIVATLDRERYDQDFTTLYGGGWGITGVRLMVKGAELAAVLAELETTRVADGRGGWVASTEHGRVTR